MKLNVAVFFGGESVEHEVSIISGHQAIDALDAEKYNVVPVYVAKDRRLYTGEALMDMKNYKDLSALKQKCTEIMLAQSGNKVVLKPVHTSMFRNKVLGAIDVAIPVMHGTNGEDGTIQGFFELLKLPYAGCDVVAAAVGQDKVQQKHILKDSGLPITDWFYCYGNELAADRETVLNKVHALGYPVILKPACTGSSIGISIAHNDLEYEENFNNAAQYDFKVITEKVVKPMREINCSVLGDCFKAEASVLEEVFHSDSEELLDYRDKYQGGSKTKSSGSKGMASTSRIVPALLDEETTQRIQNYALRTFRELGSSGVCRIDFLMNAETGDVYVNEINTIPGSLAFYLWKENGVSFPQLMDRLVELALERERRRSRMTFSYDTNLLSSYSEQGAKGAKGVKH